jgi:hypothetical protein
MLKVATRSLPDDMGVNLVHRVTSKAEVNASIIDKKINDSLIIYFFCFIRYS